MKIPQSMVDKVARALWHVGIPCLSWEEIDEESRKRIRVHACAAIGAAFAGVEVLVTNSEEPKGTMTYLHGDDEDDLCFVLLKPDDTILILRAGGEGEA